MLLTAARGLARVDADGELVTLEDQDRSLWDREAITEGCVLLDRAIRLRQPGPYQLLAGVAACHDTAASPTETDWVEIAALYDRLHELNPSPVVALNRAVAIAMADGPAAGLALVDEIDRTEALAGYYLLPATRADLLRRLGRNRPAANSYRQALALAPNDAERRYLTKRLAPIAKIISPPPNEIS